MENVSIINRKANFNDKTVQQVDSKNDIIVFDKITEEKINEPFLRCQNSGKTISNLSNLREESEAIRKEKNTMKRVLVKPENGGYILIGVLTFMGVMATGTIIFMFIKNILIK